MSPVPCRLSPGRTLTLGNGPRFHLTTSWQWSDCECGHETLSKPGLATLHYIVCCKLVICVFVISLFLICLCSGRGSSADAALVSLHQILLQQPRRLAEAEERPRQHHDQRHGQDRGDGQGVQPHLLSGEHHRRVILPWKLEIVKIWILFPDETEFMTVAGCQEECQDCQDVILVSSSLPLSRFKLRPREFATSEHETCRATEAEENFASR